jgi:ROK family
MVGVEIDEGRSIAVVVDANGAVRARAEAPGPPAESANAALRALGADVDELPAIASPLAHPSPVLAEAIAAIWIARNPVDRSHAGGSRMGSGGTGAASGHLSVVPSGAAAAVAEAWIGAAKSAQDVVYFGVAEHAVGGVVRRGEPFLGSRGRAASAAWLSLNPVEREDYRRSGCLEAEVAAAGIVRRLVWRIKAGDESSVQHVVSDNLAAITVDHVLDAARAGDGVSASVVRETAKYLGMAAANLVAIVDPEVLVLGGIMASAADLLLEPVRTEVGRRLPRAMLDSLKIEPARLGADAGAIGAAHLVAVAAAGGA